MVKLINCSACAKGDHRNCSGTQSAGPGVFGGSRCTCQCQNKPVQIPKIAFPKPTKAQRALLNKLKKDGDGLTEKGEREYRRNLKKQAPMFKEFVANMSKKTSPKR